MPRRLESYVTGAWRPGEGEGQPLHHAATGETVALIGSDGLDIEAALAWGRDIGGPALRKMTFHERALMLKAIGQTLMEMKKDVYRESFATGTTRKDGWIDIEGDIGTLLTFASKGRREVPNTRVLIGNRASAKTSTGHGSHPWSTAAPGRAGGGEEMGGMRGVKHFMQRTAVQGTPRLLSAVTGQWVDGAETRRDDHPFRKPLAELRIGDQIVSEAKTITEDDVEHFAHFTGDIFCAHMDSDAAKANPFFEDRVAHGYLIVSFAAGLFVEPNPGPVLAN